MVDKAFIGVNAAAGKLTLTRTEFIILRNRHGVKSVLSADKKFKFSIKCESSRVWNFQEIEWWMGVATNAKVFEFSVHSGAN
jgi:hypothetical protein